ncbi:MAG: divergent polysaccharide deacetylase family protein [Pseudomonadota bacterium]
MKQIGLRRPFRRPVISRLTLAWTGAGATALLLASVVAYPSLSGRGGARISLPVDGIETMARREAPAGGLRLGSPGEDAARFAADDSPRDQDADANDAASADAVDILTYSEAFPALPDEGGGDFADDDDVALAFDADDVVITIAGGARRVTPVTAARLSPVDPVTPVAEPDPALMRKVAFGTVPKISLDGRMAMHAYRSAFKGGDGRARISLLVGGLGLNAALTERAIDELPPAVSLAFAPYAKDLDYWTQKARRAGHEVLIELPMESYGGGAEALGSASLLTSRSPEENLQRLDWLMSRFGGYFAATNYQGGKFSANDDALAPILAQLRDAGVAYIDDTGAAAGARSGAVIASVDRIIPPAPDDAGRTGVTRALARLEAAAREDGAVLAKTYAYPATIEEIATWASELDKDIFMLAPASSALPARFASR